MSFLFKEDGSISKVAYQINSETCLYFKADWWGLLSATYTPQTISGQSQLIQDYQDEIAARLLAKPLSALAGDYPGTNASAFEAPNSTNASHISTAGFVIDGTHYRGNCVTRNGNYPYCDSLVVPSYSTAKSLFVGVAMMCLEQQYPAVRYSRVGNYVSDCYNYGNWGDVTLNNLLDAALQRSVSDPGTVPLTDYRYNNGFWAHNVAGNLSGCSGDQWIPLLSGYGGITVVLLPIDSVYYYFSDNDTYYWLEAVQEAHGIRSACQQIMAAGGHDFSNRHT